MDLTHGDAIHAKKSCTLYHVTDVEHRAGGLVVGTIEAQEFVEPAPTRRKGRRTTSRSRTSHGMTGRDLQRAANDGDIGGLAGYGCLD